VLEQPEIRGVCCAGSPNFRLLSGGKAKLALFHRRQDAQVSLYPAGVVVKVLFIIALTQHIRDDAPVTEILVYSGAISSHCSSVKSLGTALALFLPCLYFATVSNACEYNF